jgi:hypothetical protein
MTHIQKSFFFLTCGLIMLLGTVGGIEASPDLFSYDGLYLAAFGFAGMVMLTIGTAYANEGNE